MGNFSRDPKARIADSIAKHYVAIPLQQAVCITDADWNELQNLRRHQHETLGMRFIGSGVPDGDDGFRLVAGNTDNDFSIRRGIVLVNGKVVVNDTDTTYATQPNASAALTPGLTTPGADTTLVVYLDTWEREVNSQEDDDLIDERIGIETCVRIKREWVVRVVPGVNPQSLPAPAAGHDLYALALIKRPAGNPKITFDMIRELRRLHLTLAEATKSPLEIFGATGNLVFSFQNFAEMLDTTSRAYFDILRSDLFMVLNFATASQMEVATLSAIFNEVGQTALAASLQAKIRNLNNDDGLRVLQSLYEVQDHFVDVITPMAANIPARATTSTFLNRMRLLLDGAPGVPGLQPAAFVNFDLAAAIRAQQEINRELGSRTQILPHGRIEIKFVSGPGAEKIAPGATVRYQFNVTYVRTIAGPAQEEIFDVLPSLDPPGWKVAVVGNAQNRITLHTDETVAVAVDVTIPSPTLVTSSTLKLQIRSRLNPTEMNTTNSEVTTTVGAPPEKPKVLRIGLSSPAMNVETDTLQVGRSGFNKLIRLKFSYDEVVNLPVDFTLSLAFTPPGTFVDIANTTIKLGGTEPASKESSFNLVTTATAIPLTPGSLTIGLVKATDATLAAQPLVIKLQVIKVA